MAKQNQNAAPVVRHTGGRRHNKSNNRGTVSQDRMASSPKWEDIGGGILKYKFGKNFIKRQNGKWKSTHEHQPTSVLNNVHISLAPVAEKPEYKGHGIEKVI